MPLVHAYPGAEELGRVYSAALPIHTSPVAFAAALDKLKPRKTHDVRPRIRPIWIFPRSARRNPAPSTCRRS